MIHLQRNQTVWPWIRRIPRHQLNWTYSYRTRRLHINGQVFHFEDDAWNRCRNVVGLITLKDGKNLLTSN